MSFPSPWASRPSAALSPSHLQELHRPARAIEMFSTSVEGQTSIKLHVLQGEREMAADCRSLGLFHLRGLPPMPAGIPQVEVEFLVDANGVLNVSAHERRSGRRAALQVVPNHGLTARKWTGWRPSLHPTPART
jgi:molecular chaperone DnaK (HSP70)